VAQARIALIFNRHLGEANITDTVNFVCEALDKDVVDYLRNAFYIDHKNSTSTTVLSKTTLSLQVLLAKLE